ncbi:LytR/AlgR family response regulator transcription factor [Pontibacter chinhatensis]|uniref:Two component transcriptional regulator, LytTR family n=1 Tax=Pontibacter chinhatensis TaxID=1436961 RepID=A0A1I2X6F4_9BACT|nr:LytTR family DNA-binding domain-containing protein [Pontibacter chinhatensis]SFH08982.1 two component transcriptional regulator, LytTR family [Pontibacter chinhatensis]
MRCIIVDDEALAREGMESYVAEVDYLELVGSYNSAVAAHNAMQQHPVDLMFLDINMPRLTGLNLLELLPNPPLTILATAYPNFALEGFRLDVVDYLLKPVSLERFLKAVNKARDLYLLRQQQQAPQQPAEAEYFFVKHNRALEKVVLADILYVEGMQNYVQIHTTSQKLMVHQTIKAVAERLPEQQFFRIHKSYIVNLSQVQALDGSSVRIGSCLLPLARSQREALLQRIGHRFL